MLQQGQDVLHHAAVPSLPNVKDPWNTIFSQCNDADTEQVRTILKFKIV